jgi:hypothetical protein
MHILLEAISVTIHNRECKLKPERLHYHYGAGTPSLGTNPKRHYSCLAAPSFLLQPKPIHSKHIES